MRRSQFASDVKPAPQKLSRQLGRRPLRLQAGGEGLSNLRPLQHRREVGGEAMRVAGPAAGEVIAVAEREAEIEPARRIALQADGRAGDEILGAGERGLD